MKAKRKEETVFDCTEEVGHHINIPYSYIEGFRVVRHIDQGDVLFVNIQFLWHLH